MSKAANLARMRDAGLPVPPFRVIDGAVLSALPGPDPGAAEAAVLGAASAIGPGPWAVRSSMAGEDGARHSFAGQLDSFLGVEGRDGLLAAVRASAASATGPRAAAYRRAHGIAAAPAAMEVIVQAMVPAELSGVVFTADPIDRDPHWMLVSVGHGLGDALVRGDTAGHTLRWERATGAVHGQPSPLSPAALADLTGLAARVERLFGAPQDIEFAVAGGQIHLLQARPISPPVPTERILWDNANITESYGGQTTPMTFSIIRVAYARVYRRFMELMGVRRVDELVLRRLLGFHGGRVYYQLQSWYEALAWLPAFQHNRGFLDAMMGVKRPDGRARPAPARGHLEIARWAVRLLSLNASSERRVQDFRRHFDAVLAEHRAHDLAAMSAHQLLADYRDLEARLLDAWQAPILTDFLAMIFHGVLTRLCGRWLAGAAPGLKDALLAGDGAIESLQPVHRVAAMAAAVRADPWLAAAFARGDAAATLDAIRSDPRLRDFRADLDAYLDAYGDRCMDELKLEAPTLRDQPQRLVALIAAAASTSGSAAIGVPHDRRSDAEAELSRLAWPRRLALRWVLGHTRRHVRNRENLRFARSRLFGQVRRLLQAFGAAWAEAGALDAPGDVFYLTIDEVQDFVEGRAVSQDLRPLSRLRRAELEATRDAAPPERFETFGPPYLDRPRDLLGRPPEGGGDLRGTGCGPGVARGRVRVVTSVDGAGDLGGDILVAERMDPGWVFLFPSAGGILVERGSPLAHSAIVARELGKAIVVNIPGLTSRLRTGDLVELDGARGTVRLLDSPPAA